MVTLKDTIKKFVSNKDEYIIENTNFVTDQLTVYEQKNLQGYKDGGYAYKNSPFSTQLKQADIDGALKQKSLIEEVLTVLQAQKKQTLEEA